MLIKEANINIKIQKLLMRLTLAVFFLFLINVCAYIKFIFQAKSTVGFSAENILSLCENVTMIICLNVLQRLT